MGEPLPETARASPRRPGLRDHWVGVLLLVGALGALLLTIPLAGSGGALPASGSSHAPSPHVAAPVPVGGQHPLGNARSETPTAAFHALPRDA